jgi:aminoglycoside phosphotransferase (APT) family kinase protein
MTQQDDQFGQRLEALLAKSLPDFKELKSHERLSAGASQETYAVTVATETGERRLAMRRAPGGEGFDLVEGRPGLDGEATLMRLAADAGVPEPEVVCILEEGDDLGAGFIMEWLDGETLGARVVKVDHLAEVRPKLAYQCGQILAQIHQLDITGTVLEKRLVETQAEEQVLNNWQRYQDLGTPQPMIDFAARWLLENLPPPTERKLAHGDFRNGNLIIGPDGVRAVLDWEIAHLGDPMQDLGHLCTNSWRFGRTELPTGGFGSYKQLFSGYESVSGVPVDRDRVKFWEVFGSWWWAIGCLGMAEHFRTGPDNTIERAAIGRRSSECQVDCVNLLIPGSTNLPQSIKTQSTLDMPRADEILTGVRDFLRNDVMAQTQGRNNFMARVSANTLDILLRELDLGPSARERELAGLIDLLGQKGDLETLRWRLTNALRNNEMPLNQQGLAEHLRRTTVAQVAIDQPKYSGFKTALKNAGLEQA